MGPVPTHALLMEGTTVKTTYRVRDLKTGATLDTRDTLAGAITSAGEHEGTGWNVEVLRVQEVEFAPALESCVDRAQVWFLLTEGIEKYHVEDCKLENCWACKAEAAVKRILEGR